MEGGWDCYFFFRLYQYQFAHVLDTGFIIDCNCVILIITYPTNFPSTRLPVDIRF